MQIVWVELSSCILNHIDRMTTVLDGHNDASGIQDGIIVGSFQHLRPGVTPIIWDVHIWDHHWDGIPHATCNTIHHVLSTNQQGNRGFTAKWIILNEFILLFPIILLGIGKEATEICKWGSHVALSDGSLKNPKYNYHVRNCTKDGKSHLCWFSHRMQGCGWVSVWLLLLHVEGREGMGCLPWAMTMPTALGSERGAIGTFSFWEML